jgi:hypothetical protein
LFAASTPNTALLNHFISSIWVQWVMWQCVLKALWGWFFVVPCPYCGTISEKH